MALLGSPEYLKARCEQTIRSPIRPPFDEALAVVKARVDRRAWIGVESIAHVLLDELDVTFACSASPPRVLMQPSRALAYASRAPRIAPVHGSDLNEAPS